MHSWDIKQIQDRFVSRGFKVDIKDGDVIE